MIRSLKILIMRVRAGQMDWIDVWYYLQGTFRNWCLRTYKIRVSPNLINRGGFEKEFSLSFLVPKYIREQIKYRLDVSNPECLEKGYCVHCGCAVPALQMSDKQCDGGEYPKMMSRAAWKIFKQNVEGNDN